MKEKPDWNGCPRWHLSQVIGKGIWSPFSLYSEREGEGTRLVDRETIRLFVAGMAPPPSQKSCRMLRGKCGIRGVPTELLTKRQVQIYQVEQIANSEGQTKAFPSLLGNIQEHRMVLREAASQ